MAKLLVTTEQIVGYLGPYFKCVICEAGGAGEPIAEYSSHDKDTAQLRALKQALKAERINHKKFTVEV